MKRLFTIGILIILIVSLIGCENSNVNNDVNNEEFIDKVNNLEKNELKLSALKISYDDFITNLQKTVGEDYLNKYQQNVIIVINKESYKVSDIKNLSDEELNNLKEQLNEVKNDLNFNNASTTIEISKTYNADIKNWKYVFAKITQEDNNEINSGVITTKRYTFEKQNNKWKIINVDYDILPYSNEQSELKDELISNLKYQTINNEKVEYMETIDYSNILQ